MKVDRVEDVEEVRAGIKSLVCGVADSKAVKSRAPDWRPKAWAYCQAVATTVHEANSLMAFIGAQRKRGIKNHVVLYRMIRAIHDGHILNPLAYFTPNGVAANAIIGGVAVDRHEDEKAQRLAEEKALLGSRAR